MGQQNFDIRPKDRGNPPAVEERDPLSLNQSNTELVVPEIDDINLERSRVRQPSDPLSASSDFLERLQTGPLSDLTRELQDPRILRRALYALVVAENQNRIDTIAIEMERVSPGSGDAIRNAVEDIWQMRQQFVDYAYGWPERPIPQEGSRTFELRPQRIKADSTYNVPQNTMAIAQVSSEVDTLVTTRSYDCVSLMLYSPETRTGVLAHIPRGSDNDLTQLRIELEAAGLDPSSLQAWIVGGQREPLTYDRVNERLAPVSSVIISNLEHQLQTMGVPKSSINHFTMLSREEQQRGATAFGLDLTTGRPFYVPTQDHSRIPLEPERDFSELQDRITEVVWVDSTD